MKDPFKQADDGRWELLHRVEDIQRNDKNKITDRCKFHFAVWFPSISKKSLRNITLPQNADERLILTGEDVDDPKDSIDRILSYDVANPNIRTNLSDKDHQFLMEYVLCPTFDIIPSKSIEHDYRKKRFDALIIEQSNILNYLEYQRNAVINGIAGTGKTMIAVEKARRHSVNGEPVLFLCFNNKLKEHLEKAYPYKGVSYFTIDGYACKLCKRTKPDFDELINILFEYDDAPNTFPYQHIIIDEGQDFGQERIHADTIFELFEDIALKKENGTFYVFYDKLQIIQSEKLPKFIEDADCRLTLYKNCRNTKHIAQTSFRPLKLNSPPKLFDSALDGDTPIIAFAAKNEMKAVLDKVIKESVSKDPLNSIQIVSSINEFIVKDEYTQKNKKIPFATVRKFKGLEADHVILIDVDETTIKENNMLFYVGASRAKFQLTIIANIDDEGCGELVRSFGSSVKRNDPKASLSRVLGCKVFK